jgi:hypothetical protein
LGYPGSKTTIEFPLSLNVSISVRDSDLLRRRRACSLPGIF